MISSIVSRLVILVFGTLYPAYASYKAVRTKNVKEYVKWMMYWIVFALFTCAETFTDVFLSFWFPFYYEIKIVLVLWLLSPATKGSSILYRKFVHPMLSRREQDIDEYIAKAKEQGYHTVLHLGTKGVNYATTVIMQTAIKGGGGLVQQLRRSYSLSDLSTDKDMADVNRNSKALSNIPDDDTDEADEGSIDPRLLRPRGYSPRRSASGSGRVEMYFPEVDVDVRQHASRQREPSIPLSHIRSSEDVSSGYSSAEPLYAGHHPAKGGELTPSREPLMRTASVGSTRSVRPKSSRGGVVSKRTPTTEDSERWDNEEADFPNQEEYRCYISSSLPSQLTSIPISGQSLSQEDLFLLLQEIQALKAQKTASDEVHSIKAVQSGSTETKSEIVPEINDKSESEYRPENESKLVSEICSSEPADKDFDAGVNSLVIKSPVPSDSIPESLVSITDSEVLTSHVEIETNLSVEVFYDPDSFVDADTNISNSVLESGSETEVDQAAESECNEDTFVDANHDAEIMSQETAVAVCTISDHTVHSDSGNIEVKPADLPDACTISDHKIHSDLGNIEGKSADPADNVQSTATGISSVITDNVQLMAPQASGTIFVEINEDKRLIESPQDGNLGIENVPEITMDNEKSVPNSVDQGTEVLETFNILQQSVDTTHNDGLGADESFISDTFADLSVSSSDQLESKLLDISEDLNASSETLKLSDEQLEMSASCSATATVGADDKKDIRSGRYNKRQAPAPPPSTIPYANEDKSVERNQVSKETAVTARLVLQPGIVKPVGPEMSGSAGKSEKFISSSPKAKRKSVPRSKAKQRGSAISRLLVMPKNQLGHLTSFLPFWGSRDTTSKSTESFSSEDSNAGEQNINSSLYQEKEKEIVSQSPLSPYTNPPPSQKRSMPLSSCSLEYLPYIGSDLEFDSSGMDKAKSTSISNLKIREMSHSPPPVRRSERPLE